MLVLAQSEYASSSKKKTLQFSAFSMSVCIDGETIFGTPSRRTTFGASPPAVLAAVPPSSLAGTAGESLEHAENVAHKVQSVIS